MRVDGAKKTESLRVAGVRDGLDTWCESSTSHRDWELCATGVVVHSLSWLDARVMRQPELPGASWMWTSVHKCTNRHVEGSVVACAHAHMVYCCKEWFVAFVDETKGVCPLYTRLLSCCQKHSRIHHDETPPPLALSPSRPRTVVFGAETRRFRGAQTRAAAISTKVTKSEFVVG